MKIHYNLKRQPIDCIVLLAKELVKNECGWNDNHTTNAQRFITHPYYNFVLLIFLKLQYAWKYDVCPFLPRNINMVMFIVKGKTIL